MMRLIYFTSLVLLLQIRVSAQDLPHTLSAEEKALMPAYLQSIQSKGFTIPPTGPLRTPGEWEEVEGITISWTTSYRPILAQIVNHAQQECTVYINCTDSVAVKNYLNTNGVTPVNVKYIITDFNSIWIRDYGAQSVYKNDVDSLILVDWIYNRPRPLDDVIPVKLSDFTGIPLYQTTAAPYALVHTGGNFMADGFGTAFSSNLVLNENSGLSNAQVDLIMQQFMGISRYVKMTNLPYDGIHHIDMHMKLLDEHTLLVGQYPSGVSDGPQVEANLQYVLSNICSVFGVPYKVIRIPMPPDPANQNYYPNNGGSYLTYTNGIFVNKTYLVPTYYAQYDTIALRILQENLPGYNVVGINCNSIIPASGAIHCITNSIGSRNPLLISHYHADTLDATMPGVHLKARIQHRSGISSAKVFLRFGGPDWDSIPMNLVDTLNHIWEYDLPIPCKAGVPTTTLEYYFAAVSNSGKRQVRPITAPTGYYTTHLLNFGGINDKIAQSSIRISDPYPNPATDQSFVMVETAKETIGEISLFSVEGQHLQTIYQGEFKPGKQQYLINTSGKAKGLYILLFRSSEGNISKRLLIK